MANSKRLFSLLGSGLLALSPLGFVLVDPLATRAADEGAWGKLPEDFSLSYKLGDTLSVPTMTYEGAEQINGELLFPDNTAKYGDNIRLTEPGIYELRYSALKDGVTYSLSYDITVKNTLYTFSGTQSQAAYMTYVKHGEGEGEVANLKQFPNTGIWVNLAKGETMTFNDPFPLSAFDGSEFLQAFVTPKNRGTADFNSLDIILTDAEDPSIYLTFNVARHTDTDRYTALSSVKVAGQNQPLTGFEQGKNIYHVKNAWGCTVNHSFTDVEYSRDPVTHQETVRNLIPASKFQFALGYDNVGKVCYAGRNNGREPVYNTMNYVADLDSLDAYTEIWPGFSSGNVYLSIRANTYSSKTADFMITYMRDIPDLSLETVEDEVGPDLSVDTSYEPNAMPEAYLNKPYTLPHATAHDAVSGDRPVEVSVDYNYISGSPEQVDVQDGYFLPMKRGVYRIRYVAKDSFRNEASKTFYVHAGGDIATLKVIPEKSEDTSPIGILYSYPSYRTEGGSGSSKVRVYAKQGEQEKEITDEGGFIPETAGDYQILYRVSDFAGGSAEAAIALKAVANDVPVIAEKPVLPRYFLAGASYPLPELIAADYSSGSKKEMPCQVEVTMGGSSQTYTAGDSFTPTASKNGDVASLRYFAGKNSLETIEVPVVLASEEGHLNLLNYFVGAEGVGTLSRSGVTFLSDSNEGSVNWTFANALASDGVSLTIGNVAGKSNFTSLAMKIEDSEDPSISVTALITLGTGAMTLTLDGTNYPLQGTLQSKDAFAFTMSFSGSSFTYQASSSSTLKVSHDDAGKAFSGFPSGLVYLSLSSLGMEEGNGYLVSSVSSQPISSYARSDVIAPNLFGAAISGGMYPLGSTYTVDPAEAHDVLAPYSSVSFTVTGPDGQVVKDVNGVALEKLPATESHTFSLDAYGSYLVNFTSQEVGWAWQNSSTYAYSVQAIDTTAPSLRLLGKMPETVKVGGKITLPEVEAHDDLTADENLKIYACVILPSGVQRELTPGQAITADTAGNYDFFVFAMDEFGNSTSFAHTVKAVKN